MNLPELNLIHSHSHDESVSTPVFLLCVFRDEFLLLDYFIKYYQDLGVTHFIMIDNLSIDLGSEYLKQLKNINLVLYQANGSYRDAAYGTDWINQLLDKHCIGQYCFTVDVDELFFFDKTRFRDLGEIISTMEAQKKNVIATTLLDMYPKQVNDEYPKGVDFLLHSPYFDVLNPCYYKAGFLYGGHLNRAGGVRERVLQTTVCLHKFPFFKYNFQPMKVAPGFHVFQKEGEVLLESEKIKLLEYPAVLLHFKFIKPHLDLFFKRRVALNQDWDNSSEYKSYVDSFENNPTFDFFDEKYSQKMNSIESLKLFFKSIYRKKIDS